MANIKRETIRSLAVLRVLFLWQHGAYGPVRLHKTMFAADRASSQHIFTYKKYYLGQYSQNISDALNTLQSAGRLKSIYDGPAERLKAVLSLESILKIKKLFSRGFPEWEKKLKEAFSVWGYLTNDQILKKAHEDATYTETIHDQIILESTLPAIVSVPSLDDEDAEELNDLVDDRLVPFLKGRIQKACKIPAADINWRHLVFGE